MDRKDALGQAEKQVEKAQKRAARKKIEENLPKFRFEAHHVEKHRDDVDWTARLHARGPEGEVVRNLFLTVKTPSPLAFDRTYEWELLCICPLWVEAFVGPGMACIRFSANTKREKSR